MDRGLYIAASGMLAERRRQDAISNDLANAQTPGYKADRTATTSFGELLLTHTTSGRTIGTQTLGITASATVTDLRPQALRETGEPLDFAVEGEGWFRIQTPDGERYTRDGRFASGPGGTLVDARGNRVITAGDTPVAVQLDGVEKAGEGYVTGNPQAGRAGRVRSGALEGSGVDATQSMVDMVASARVYEAGSRSIQTIDETLRKAASSVGNLTG